jgi:hypothetical protein
MRFPGVALSLYASLAFPPVSNAAVKDADDTLQEAVR